MGGGGRGGKKEKGREKGERGREKEERGSERGEREREGREKGGKRGEGRGGTIEKEGGRGEGEGKKGEEEGRKGEREGKNGKGEGRKLGVEKRAGASGAVRILTSLLPLKSYIEAVRPIYSEFDAHSSILGSSNSRDISTIITSLPDTDRFKHFSMSALRTEECNSGTAWCSCSTDSWFLTHAYLLSSAH